MVKIFVEIFVKESLNSGEANLAYNYLNSLFFRLLIFYLLFFWGLDLGQAEEAWTLFSWVN